MSTIGYNKFIFSDEKKYRIKRHLTFWFFWGMYFSLVRILNPGFFPDNGHFSDVVQTMAAAFLQLLPQAVLVYPLLYFILPRYVFNGKYIKALLLIIPLLLMVIFINAFLFT